MLDGFQVVTDARSEMHSQCHCTAPGAVAISEPERDGAAGMIVIGSGCCQSWAGRVTARHGGRGRAWGLVARWRSRCRDGAADSDATA